jgi:hypothetical protein
MFESEILYDALASPVCDVPSTWSEQPDVMKNTRHKAAHCVVLEAESGSLVASRHRRG